MLFNKPDPNELIFSGSPGEAALRGNVQMVGYIAIFIVMAFGFWVGLQGPKPSKTVTYITLALMLAICIGTGTLLGLSGGLVMMLWMAIGGGVGYWRGTVVYKREHPEA